MIDPYFGKKEGVVNLIYCIVRYLLNLKGKYTMRNILILALISFSVVLSAQRQMEKLDRGVIAMRTATDSAYISWRLLDTDPSDIAFDIYRTEGEGKEQKRNAEPLRNSTQFADSKVDFSKAVVYTIRPASYTNSNLKKSAVQKKSEANNDPLHKGPGNSIPAVSGTYKIQQDAAVCQYLTVPVQQIPNYKINDGSAADLDGDGQYELIIKREMSPRDNSHKGITGQSKLEAYKLDGTFLWRIDLGRNIREGAHYTQFMVYDLDGDGSAEIVCKTADGTIDGQGKVIGDSSVDNRNEQGHIYKGPEYLTVFNGKNGAEINTTQYLPGRHPELQDASPQQMKDVWGDDHYNRSERYLACIAYLDGKHPSVVMCRGYYTRSVLAAFDLIDGKLVNRWVFDSDSGNPEDRKYRGQGNHNLSVADVDGDGRDEIIYGACCIDDNGKGLYSTGLKHGDAIHLSDLDPENPGLEVFIGHESQSDVAGAEFRDARTGKLLWGLPSKGDVGRSMAANIDPRYKGSECWTFGPGMSGLYSAKGELLSAKTPWSCNFTIYWDGDFLQELLDRTFVAKYNWKEDKLDFLLNDRECRSNNGTKATPVLSADLFGDWREEIVWKTADDSALRIYSTTIPTNHRLVTLMQDPVYRMGVARENVGYNQPPHVSYYLDEKLQEQ